jgi:hypothetical protein
MLARPPILALLPLGRIRIGFAMRRTSIAAAARFALALLSLGLAPIGCVSGGRKNPPAESSTETKPPHEEVNEQLNQLWEEGYGYNNPNAERIKQGLPPIPFHGE